MTALGNIALLLDGPFRYWTVAYLAVLCALFVTFTPVLGSAGGERLQRLAGRLSHPGWFALAIGLALLAMRWPLCFIPIALNPDESQVIAQAITLLEDPVIFRAAQSGSTGPFWTYFIMPPGLLGMDVNYASTRFIGIIIMAVTLAGLYAAVRLVSGEMAARLATWPALLCFGLPRFERDFIHYSSEYPALPLLAAALFLMLFYDRNPARRPLLVLFLLGVALGGLPFAKLQTAVIALPIAAFAGLHILLVGPKDTGRRIRGLAALAGGGLVIPGFFFLLFLSTGVFGYFWNVYIVNNFHYKERGAPFLTIIGDYMTTPIGYEPVPLAYKTLTVAGLAFCLLRFFSWLRQRGRRGHPWIPVAFAAFVFAVAVYAVGAPGRHFPHYLHFIVLPLCLLFGVFMHEQAPTPAADNGSPLPGGLTRSTILGAALVVVPFLSLLLRPILFGPSDYNYPGVGRLKQLSTTEPKFPAPFINQFKREGDHLSVWGWHADYYVDTQLPMGTRSAVSEFHIRDVPLRDYYRRYYLEEFKRRMPAFFIDAVGPLSLEFQDPALHGHQTFPELATYVAQNYTEATNSQGPAQVRLFIRNDRADEIRALQQPRQPQQPPPPSG